MAAERVYLAGPEVFLPDPAGVADGKKRICAEYGFVGVFPLDKDLDLSGLGPRDMGWRIAQANEGLMRGCALVVANMTPYRGPSMDVGAAYEMGFMRALGRPVFGYTNTPGFLGQRTRAATAAFKRLGDEAWRDADGMSIERFEMVDNAMLHGAVLSSGGEIAVGDVARPALYTDLTAFAACVAAARGVLDGT